MDAAIAAAAFMRCWASTAALAAVIQDDASAAALMISIGWAGTATRVTTESSVVIVERPIFKALKPGVLRPGGAAIIEGMLFCAGDPLGQCYSNGGAGSDVANPPIQLWLEYGRGLAPSAGSLHQACTNVQVITDEIATCTPPDLPASLPGYPAFTAVLQNNAVVFARQWLNATYPLASGYVRSLSAVPLPTRFVPSDASSRWLLPQSIVVGAVLAATGQPFDGQLECSIAPRTVGVLLLPAVDGMPLSAVAGTNNVSFGRIAIQAPFGVPVVLAVTCTAPQSSDVLALAALEWTLQPYELSVTLCDALPAAIESQLPLPAFRIAIALDAGNSSSTSTGSISGSGTVVSPPECAANRTFSAFPLPGIACSAFAEAANATAMLQGSSAAADARSGIATFAALSMSGTRGAEFTLRMRCFIGSIAIPGGPAAAVRITGCAAGTQPVDSVCAPCGSGQWSDGGADTCHSCPLQGATCEGGRLRLLPGFYLPPGRRGQLLDASARLYECLDPQRCIVVVSNASSGTAQTATALQCSIGATGPLCALCDVDAGYANVGGYCQPCPSAPLSSGVIAVAIALFVGGIAYLVLRKPGDGAAQRAAAFESIALRIMLTHIQALAALRAFRTAGLSVFRTATGWAEALTPAILSEGPSSCVLKPSYSGTFIATLSAPLVACGLGLLILLCATVLGQGKRPEGRLQSSSSHAPKATAASTAARTAARSSMCERLWAVRWRSEAERVLVLILSLAYMSVVSACIGALDCSEPIDGVSYLRSDYRVECRGGSYAVLAAVAIAVVLVVGGGFPVLIFLRLRHVSSTEALALPRYAAWAFLFLGYRVPDTSTSGASTLPREPLRPQATAGSGDADAEAVVTHNPFADDGSIPAAAVAAAGKSHDLSHSPVVQVLPSSSAHAASSQRLSCCGSLRRKTLVSPRHTGPTDCTRGHLGACLRLPLIAPDTRAFWESTVLLRKLAIVLLARLVPQPLPQVSVFVAVMLLFLTAHLVWKPYRARQFELVEGASLLCLALTACLSINAAPSAGAPPEAAALANAAILVINAIVLLLMLWTWLRLCSPRYFARARALGSIGRQKLCVRQSQSLCCSRCCCSVTITVCCRRPPVAMSSKLGPVALLHSLSSADSRRESASQSVSVVSPLVALTALRLQTAAASGPKAALTRSERRASHAPAPVPEA